MHKLGLKGTSPADRPGLGGGSSLSVVQSSLRNFGRPASGPTPGPTHAHARQVVAPAAQPKRNAPTPAPESSRKGGNPAAVLAVLVIFILLIGFSKTSLGQDVIAVLVVPIPPFKGFFGGAAPAADAAHSTPGKSSAPAATAKANPQASCNVGLVVFARCSLPGIFRYHTNLIFLLSAA